MKYKILHLPLVFQSKELFAWDARIYHLAQQFSKKANQYDFEFFAPSKEPKPQPDLFGYKATEFPIIGPSDNYLFTPKLLQAVREHDADLIHCHGANNLVTFGALIVKKPNQKLVLTINSAGSSSVFRKILIIPYYFAFRLLANRVDHFIAVSEFEKNRFMKLLGLSSDRFTVIPNGTEKELIESIQVTKKRKLIVSTGRLVKNKGFEDLIQVYYNVCQLTRDAKLLIIGDGPERKNLEALAKSYYVEGGVTFAGYIGRERRVEFLTLLKEAELFIFLSRYESLPLNVVEAVTARLPVMIPYNSGMAEFVDRDEAIGIVDPKNHHAIAEKIVHILDNPSDYVPKKIYTKSWEVVAEETIKVYQKVLGEKNE